MFSINTQYIIQHLLTYLSPRWLPVGVLFVLLGTGAFGQSPETKLQLSGNIPDTLTQPVDSMSLDTLQKKPAAKNPPLEAEVKYTADDSLSISLGTHQVFMYKNASVDYQDIKLKANYIDFSLDNNTVTAHGIPDSTGHLVGKPVFTQGSEEFDSDTIRYDFKTHKGIIKYIITKQGEGFLHSERTKRLADGEIHVSKGKYTTCDKPHPDFYIRLTKAIVIPNKKIVSGPAYLVLEDIPLPLAIGDFICGPEDGILP
jgi:lipopolysaccharide assembly outer membrane protein LptD (OstA)